MREANEIEISAICTSNSGPGIGFGLISSYTDISPSDVSWIYEGMSESISENLQDFEAIADEVESECLSYFQNISTISPSKEDVRKKIISLLQAKLGEYSFAYETDYGNINLQFDVSTDDISASVYTCICDNFAIDSRVYSDITSNK